ncbi:GNAT family N-acetyltransferase [Streptomyces sp. NPDC002476]|uniref:GNAT family N-acetyltransferase n=1 Tax=Streptomyces sp. NPDC002476 TaxID=3364648 RepID=UPI003687FA5C
MKLRRATPADATALMALRIEAEQWLVQAGIDQWRNPRTRGPALAKWMLDVDGGRTWIVEDSHAVLATVTLASPDMDFWRENDHPQNALYIAKLITARSAKNSHLGGRLLDWAAGQAQQQGKSWIRLDCWRSNTRLQQYYLREGFRHVRTERPEHRLSGWLGERPASVVRYPASLLDAASTAREPTR